MTSPTRSELLAIFIGGCAGALARTGLSEAFPVGAGFPWTTLAINVAGAFILGLVLRKRFAPLLLGTGFCGALTTFSTVQVELLDLLRDGRGATAAAYALASVVAGYAAVVLAAGLMRRA